MKQEKVAAYYRKANKNALKDLEQQKAATVLSALDRDIKILGTDSLEDNKTVSQKLSEAAAKGVIDCVVINNKEHFDGNEEHLADLEKKGIKIIEAD